MSIKTASYGKWISPITAEKIAEGVPAILNMIVDGDTTYWCEMRPTNQGRYTIVQRDTHEVKDVTPQDFNVRTFVHEYGGGAFTTDQGVIYASCAADHAIYKIVSGEKPIKLTQGQTWVEFEGKKHPKGTRFADMRPSPHGLIAIGEKHEPGSPVENFLALINTKTGEYKKIASGFDFYASPALSPDKKKIAWICWNHPNMPWTHTELWSADFKDGTISRQKLIAGAEPEAIMQPQWSSDGLLYFISDRNSGWWNLHREIDGKVENICPIHAEVGEPLWILDRSAYAFLGERIVFAYNKDGSFHLGIVDPNTKKMEPIQRNCMTIQHVRQGNGFVQFLEGYAEKPESLVQIDNQPGYPSKILRKQLSPFEEGYISIPKHIAFPSNGRTAYGFYYAPKNKDYKAPSDEKPPLVIMIHGGPTSQAKGAFQLKQQFWTSRGFAVLDVNYGGSTGYGRAYRSLLNRNWGIVDVEDCENGAIFLAKQEFVDPEKLVIRGGSAGGYTTLAALAFRKTFKAGASYYGVADITALANDTHKFEARYMEQLVGKYPEEKTIWKERSPIHSVDKIKSPLIIFQGANDTIVPPNQSIMIYEALKERGIPTELHIYEGEEHGFRQAVHIIHSHNREVEFYLEVFDKKG